MRPGAAPRDFASLVPLRSLRPHRRGKDLRVLLIVMAPAFARDGYHAADGTLAGEAWEKCNASRDNNVQPKLDSTSNTWRLRGSSTPQPVPRPGEDPQP